MKNILFIGMSPNHGGVETFLLNVFDNLDDEFNCFFIQENDNNIYGYEHIKNNDGKIISVNIGEGLTSHFIRYKAACNFFKENDIRFDIIHLNCVSINSLYWIKAASKFTNARLIIHSHNSFVTENNFFKNVLINMLSFYNRIYLRKNNKIVKVAASKKAGSWMFHSDDYTVIPNGINSKEYKYNSDDRLKVRDEMSIKNSKVILVVGRLEYQKNYERVIQIFREIIKKDDDYRLIICGEGSQKKQIIRDIHENNIEKKVFLLGDVSNISKIYSASDILLMPSRYEAFPYTLVESQANGLISLVSSPAVPKECNITGNVRYMSLSDSNKKWSEKIINLINIMVNRNLENKKIEDSKYDAKSMVSLLKKIYLYNNEV